MDLAPKPEKVVTDTVHTLPLEQRLRTFMHEVSGRALVMMESATHGQDGIASDLVQEAFIALHKAYPHKSIDEWYPLFYTILNNKLQDWRRKELRRSSLFGFMKQLPAEDDIEDIADENSIDPLTHLADGATAEEIYTAIQTLPIRQQQAFSLRAWEGFDTATTAQIMNCTEGSVKTHYHRAIQGLRTKLAHLNPELGGTLDEE